MKKFGKSFLSIMLVFTILLGAAPLSGFKGVGSSLWNGLCSLAVSAKEGVEDFIETLTPANVPDNSAGQLAATGQCGDNVYWSFDLSTGALTISGTGDMYDYALRDSPFYDNSYIKSVTIASGVTSIGDYAFEWCSSLTSVTIGNSVTSICDNAFNSCSSLTSISVDSNNKAYSSDSNGILYNKDKTELIRYPTGNERASFTIPNSVTNIGTYAFYVCNSLRSINIPDSVTSIGDGAFAGCIWLTSVTIGNGVTSIGWVAFYNCSSLTSITVDSDNKNYGSDSNGVLYNKDKTELIQYPIGNKRTSFSIPSSVLIIGNYAFSFCSKLTSIDIPDSVTCIENSAFSGCNKLTNIRIPNSVMSIGAAAFEFCGSLTSIKIPDSVTSISDYVFFECSNLKSIEIPDGITSIGEGAFFLCNSLTSVEIPDSVMSIGEWAFDYCDSLIIKCYENSCAHQYAIRNGISFRLIGIGEVKSVSISDMTLGYKSTAIITPKITADQGADFKVTFTSSNPSAISVDDNGRVTSNKTFGFTPGSAVITVTVTDSNGNTVSDTCTVTVQFTPIQWIIKIVLFGWIWY